MLGARSNNLFGQLAKFAVVGAMNTAVDFAVLNFLLWATGIYSGRWIILLNAIAFTAAVINSYIWNKFWTFRAEETTQAGVVTKEFSQFLIVSLIGMGINSGIVYGITTFIPPILGIGPEFWANFAKLAATGASLVWNFIGYKFIVFKR